MSDTYNWGAFEKKHSDLPVPTRRAVQPTEDEGADQRLSLVPADQDAATTMGDSTEAASARPPEADPALDADTDHELRAAAPRAESPADRDPVGQGSSDPVVGDSPAAPSAAPQQRRAAPERRRTAVRAREAAPAAGARISAKDRAEQKATRVAAGQVKTALSDREVRTGEVRGLEVSAQYMVVEVTGCDPEDVLDHLDAICETFGVEDLEAETGKTSVVLYIPVAMEGPARQAAAWVPMELRERVRAHSAATGESVTQQVLTAFNLYYDQLGAWFHRPEHVAGPMAVGALRRREVGEAQVQIYLYLKTSQKVRLDATVKSCGAGSRSELVTRLLEEFLPES